MLRRTSGLRSRLLRPLRCVPRRFTREHRPLFTGLYSQSSNRIEAREDKAHTRVILGSGLVAIFFVFVAFGQSAEPRPLLSGTPEPTPQEDASADSTGPSGPKLGSEKDDTHGELVESPSEPSSSMATGESDVHAAAELDATVEAEVDELALEDSRVEDWLETPLQGLLEQTQVGSYLDLFGKPESEFRGRMMPTMTDLRFWQATWDIRTPRMGRKGKARIKLSFVRTNLNEPDSPLQLASISTLAKDNSEHLRPLIKERLGSPKDDMNLEGRKRSVWTHEGLTIVLEKRRKYTALILAEENAWARLDARERSIRAPYQAYKKAKRALLGSSPNLPTAISEGRKAMSGFEAVHDSPQTIHGHTGVNLCHALYRNLELAAASEICERVREHSVEAAAQGEAAFFLARIKLRQSSPEEARALFIEAQDGLPAKSRYRPLITMYLGLQSKSRSRHMRTLLEFYGCERQKKLGKMHKSLHLELGFNEELGPYRQAEDLRIEYTDILEKVTEDKRCQPSG